MVERSLPLRRQGADHPRVCPSRTRCSAHDFR